MLYGSDYDSLFTGTVNEEPYLQPEDFEEEEKMEEKKTLKERCSEFIEEHEGAFWLIYCALCAGAGIFLGKKLYKNGFKAGYRTGVSDGWNKFYQVHGLMFDDRIEQASEKMLNILSKRP